MKFLSETFGALVSIHHCKGWVIDYHNLVESKAAHRGDLYQFMANEFRRPAAFCSSPLWSFSWSSTLCSQSAHESSRHPEAELRNEIDNVAIHGGTIVAADRLPRWPTVQFGRTDRWV